MSGLRKTLRPLGSALRALRSSRRNVLLDVDLDRPLLDIAAPDSILFRPARREDVVSFLADPDHEVPARAASRHLALLAAGEPFWVGTLSGRIVYRAWAVRAVWRIAGPHHLTLGRGKATILGCFTVADQRGLGIYPAALVAQMRHLKELGVRRVFINSEEQNTASLRGIEKAGFRRLGVYEVSRLAGRVSLRIEPALRRAVESDWPE